MYSERRQLPLEISKWMDEDVSIRKLTSTSRLMPNDSRQNGLLSRQFFSNMLNLSSERYRKIAQFDFDKKTFIKNQLYKAETTMPGLLPYVGKILQDMDDDTSARLISSTNSQFASSSIQSFLSHSTTKSELSKQQSSQRSRSPQTMKPLLPIAIESSDRQQQISSRRSRPLQPMKPLLPIPKKSSNRQQISLARINQLAKPKGHRTDLTTTDHIRSNNVREITVHDLFGNLDELHHHNSVLPNEPQITTNDKRFRQLVHLFSQVHEREPSNLQSVKSLIKSNPSLQADERRWRRASTPISQIIESENDQEILHDECVETDAFLIDVGA